MVTGHGTIGETRLKIRGLLTTCAAIATVAGAALAGQGSAAAATVAPAATSAAVSTSGKTAAHPVPASAFKNGAGRATPSRPGGFTPAAGMRFNAAAGLGARTARTAGTAAAGCAEPACNLADNGGPVQHAPQVYVVFWGPKWTTTEGPTKSYLLSFYQGLGTSPDTWSALTSQYGDAAGNPAFGSSVLAGSFNDTTTPPNPVRFDDLATEASNALSHFSISNTNDESSCSPRTA